MSFPKGGVQPKHKVNCMECKASLELSTHWRNPLCRDCREKRWVKFRADNAKVIREQARRYRIVLHVLGWEDEQFPDMLEEMKASPMAFRTRPESRAAKVDLTWEEKLRQQEHARRRRIVETAKRDPDLSHEDLAERFNETRDMIEKLLSRAGVKRAARSFIGDVRRRSA